MKKFLFVLLLVLCLPVYADDYKILQMNSNSIQIGNSLRKQGDLFSDNDIIVWSDDNQAIKAMHLKTKQIKLFIAKSFKKTNAKSIKQYFLKSMNLSTRGELASFDDLKEVLSDTIYIFDITPIESPVIIDSLSSYIISYYDDSKKWRNLMSTEDSFFLSRELFDNDNKLQTYTLSLYYRTRDREDYLITNELNVVILPLQVEE